MTKLEAVRTAVSRMEISARMVYASKCGDDREYIPDTKDLELLSALAGREVTESDLYFRVGAGAYSRNKFVPCTALLNEIQLPGEETHKQC